MTRLRTDCAERNPRVKGRYSMLVMKVSRLSLLLSTTTMPATDFTFGSAKGLSPS